MYGRKLTLTFLSSAIYMIAVCPAADGYVTGQAYNALYATIVGPFFLTILLFFVSGLPLSERPTAKKRYENDSNWEGYERYLRRTSMIILFPPQIYEHVPVFIKRTLFLEFPIYVFDPAKHSEVGRGGAKRQAETQGEEGEASRRNGHGNSADGLVEEGRA